MSDTAWVAVATLSFFVTSGFVGWLWAQFNKIERALGGLHNKIEDRTTALGNKLETLLDTHERRDQERFVETIERLTRVETVALNGHVKRKRAIV